jgi:molybdate transport system ATP-binding protein
VTAPPIELSLEVDRGAFRLSIDLRLPARGVTALFGPSGCGKTTVLRCVAGLERAAGGRVVVGGETWQDGDRFVPPHRRAIGMVFQEPSLFPHLSVRGNLAFGQRRAEPAAGASGFALGPVIELLGLGDLLDRRPAGLSGGERQRVAIARALAVAPQLLLMDEPLAALDAARKAEILPFLDRLHRELTIPILYVTHSVPEVTRLADHLVLLQAGQVLAQGSLTEMMSRLDVSLAQDEGAGVVVPARVAERDRAWHLARLDFDGGSLWTRDAGHAEGTSVRVRVLARDVSLAPQPPAASSITNVLQGRVRAIANDGSHPALALALVDVGRVVLMARLTRQSVDRLGLVAGSPVWAQVKSVALVD